MSMTPIKCASGLTKLSENPSMADSIWDFSTHMMRILKFMQLAEQEIPDAPCIPSAEVRLLRAKLIMEEALETIEALGVKADCEGCQISMNGIEFYTHGEPDLVEIVDGVCDISVVSLGTLLACGCTDLPFLHEVDESNLRKFGPGGYRREDGKWIKPPDWQPPNITGILKEQGWTPEGKDA